MQAVVNQPHTQNTEAAYFRIEGKVPKFVIMFLESAFKDSLKIEKNETEDDEESIRLEDWDWYKEITASMTPGDAIKADRGLRGWTQKVLAKKLKISVQNLSEIERNIRPISREMASKLSKVFGTPPSTYFKV